jgi:hypothetical protein
MRKWAVLDENNKVVGSFSSPIDQDHAVEIATDMSIQEMQGKIYAAGEGLKPDYVEEATKWRNAELRATDWIATAVDHPNYDNMVAYRQALRDWPSTPDFPMTQPVPNKAS